MDKEIRITLDEIIKSINNDVDSRFDLLQDKYSIESRKEFITQVYYTYIREVKANNKLCLRYIDSSLQGNLASWYANTLSYEKSTPKNYRVECIRYIQDLFVERYEVE